MNMRAVFGGPGPDPVAGPSTLFTSSAQHGYATLLFGSLFYGVCLSLLRELLFQRIRVFLIISKWPTKALFFLCLCHKVQLNPLGNQIN